MHSILDEFGDYGLERTKDEESYMERMGIPEDTPNPLCDEYFTQAELSQAIHNLNTAKATGEDRIEASFIAQLHTLWPEFSSGILLPLMNKVFGSGHVPNSWKLDRRIPLEKDGDSTAVSNYRTIAIHSVASGRYFVQ